jgi:hypothetical protein
VRVIAAPTGTGKTSAAAKFVAKAGSTCWLADRHEDVAAAVAAIEAAGGLVGRTLPLHGKTDGVPHCLHPSIIEWWQMKGYSYRQGFCLSETKEGPCCKRRGDPDRCLYLGAIRDLKDAAIICTTKAYARRPGFFSSAANGNSKRRTVILDEDPVELLRPPILITRSDLQAYMQLLDRLMRRFNERGEAAAYVEARRSQRLARWAWERMAAQAPEVPLAAVPVPPELRRTRAVLRRTKRANKQGRKDLVRALHREMRRDPQFTVRNVYRDLEYMAKHAAAATVFVTAASLLFHLRITIPRERRVFVLDATANPDLLRPLFAPRPVEVLCAERVKPAGRVIQFMDANGPRSYLNKVPPKFVRIINALGDLHPDGKLVLISHRSCVDALAKASKHVGRIKTAHFGALRGRNDLEPSAENRIACHIVVGSPKTTEEDRRQLALAVYGEAILPFADLVDTRRAVVGSVPAELQEGEGDDAEEWLWEVRMKGYADPRMQAVYDHTVTAELTHAADRARVLIHPGGRVYLVTNEPCPRLWFAEMCLARDYLDLSGGPRADFAKACEEYEAKAQELLNAGRPIGNADVCRALGRKDSWGLRYWHAFLGKYGDALEGSRKVRWKDEGGNGDK